MRYSGSVYRPPSEAYSLIVQCTLGCSHNKCAFCNMYKEKRFSIRPIEDVLEDLAGERRYHKYINRVFLADGDALILPMDYLITVLDYIAENFPECDRVAAYATTKAIKRKTDEELRILRAHGLRILYIGLETGNEELLKKYNKGATVEETVVHSLRAKEAGMALSITAINGMAGSNGDWQAHAIDTAKAISRMNPEYAAFLTLRVYADTPLHDWVESGEIKLMDPIELVQETRVFLEHVDSEGTVFRSNHASNYLPLGGTLNRDRDQMICTIDAALDGKVRFRRAVELGF
ncbi:MAG: B12-binding domain-containing radical SAM protein [Oscillospiraceae bacterium]|nr:B12-binding domain-containing radical SAM protein [Oscillospiraceae bacterium]MBR6739098.1 B12-binding domain-containing radical SAM protein [Oscillospiraceae bacterium]